MSPRAALVNRASMSSEPVSLLCQYGTGIPSLGEGGRERGRVSAGRREERRGGRTEEGGRDSGGEGGRGEERANVGRARLLRSSVIVRGVKGEGKKVCFLLFRGICPLAAVRRCFSGSLQAGRVCFSWDATVNCPNARRVAGACMAAEC